VVDGECRESGSIGIPKLEGRVAVPSLGEGLDHGVVGLLGGPTCLVVHDVNHAARSMLEKSKALGVVKVRNAGNVMGNPFSHVLRSAVLEQAFLDEILESFIGEVDTELVEGVGTAGHVLWSRKIE